VAKWLWSLAACIALAMAGAGVSNAQGKILRLAVLGDSLTAGFGLNAKDAFPAVLEREMRAKGMDVEVLNFGVSGDTTAGGLSRLGPVIAARPGGVILELGANDGLRGLDPALVEANLEAIITALGKNNIPVLLTGMRALLGMGKGYSDEFAQVFNRLARKHTLPFYPFFLEGVAGDRTLNQPDGLHPTPEGVRVIVRNILPTAMDFAAGLAKRK